MQPLEFFFGFIASRLAVFILLFSCPFQSVITLMSRNHSSNRDSNAHETVSLLRKWNLLLQNPITFENLSKDSLGIVSHFLRLKDKISFAQVSKFTNFVFHQNSNWLLFDCSLSKFLLAPMEFLNEIGPHVQTLKLLADENVGTPSNFSDRCCVFTNTQHLLLQTSDDFFGFPEGSLSCMEEMPHLQTFSSVQNHVVEDIEKHILERKTPFKILCFDFFRWTQPAVYQFDTTQLEAVGFMFRGLPFLRANHFPKLELLALTLDVGTKPGRNQLKIALLEGLDSRNTGDAYSRFRLFLQTPWRA